MARIEKAISHVYATGLVPSAVRDARGDGLVRGRNVVTNAVSSWVWVIFVGLLAAPFRPSQMPRAQNCGPCLIATCLVRKSHILSTSLARLGRCFGAHEFTKSMVATFMWA